jgi:hypothetical protein
VFFASFTLDFDTVTICVVRQSVFMRIHIQRLRGFDLRQKIELRIRRRVAVAVSNQRRVAGINVFAVGPV